VTFRNLAERLKGAEVNLHLSIRGPSGNQPVFIDPEQLGSVTK